MKTLKDLHTRGDLGGTIGVRGGCGRGYAGVGGSLEPEANVPHGAGQVSAPHGGDGVTDECVWSLGKRRSVRGVSGAGKSHCPTEPAENDTNSKGECLVSLSKSSAGTVTLRPCLDVRFFFFF